MRAADHRAVRAAVLAKHAEEAQVMELDIIIENHGSLFLLVPQNDDARAWLEAHVAEEDAMWFGSAARSGLVVEPRYVFNIINGAVEAGLEVR